MYASWLRISFQSHLNGQVLEESRSFKGTIFQPLVKTVTRICNPRYVAFVIRTHWVIRIGFGLIDLFARYDLSRMFNYALHVMEML